jgi:adenine-specific DNA glycosylase
LWEFPNIEASRANTDPKQAAQEALGYVPGSIEPLCSLTHSITRYRITLDVFAAKDVDLPRAVSGRWLGLRSLRRLPFAAAHKKILGRLDRGSLARTRQA